VNAVLWPGWWKTTLLRAVVFLGPVVALLATGPAGNWPGGGLVALTLALAGGFAVMPESALGTVVFCVVVVWWGFGMEHVAVEAVGAAAALLAAHLAALLLSYGPAQLPLDGRLLGLWVRRGLLVGLSVPAVWLLATAVDGQPEPPGIWVAALVAAVAVCAVGAAAVTERAPE
jgi:hypothetical protein